jgi:hypothetical protein
VWSAVTIVAAEECGDVVVALVSDSAGSTAGGCGSGGDCSGLARTFAVVMAANTASAARNGFELVGKLLLAYVFTIPRVTFADMNKMLSSYQIKGRKYCYDICSRDKNARRREKYANGLLRPGHKVT